MNGLRPELLEIHGFEGATKEYLRKFERRHAVICEFTCDIPYLKLDPQQSLSLFRILQETMNNIAKHANATRVNIHLKNREETLWMEIIDDGVGFDKRKSGREDSYGLIGMQERVVLLEGKLNITSKVGQGTTVRVEMPYSGKTEIKPLPIP